MIVVGGGIAGLTAAHELAIRGFEVHVVERASEERIDSKRPRPALGGQARSEYTWLSPSVKTDPESGPGPRDIAFLDAQATTRTPPPTVEIGRVVERVESDGRVGYTAEPIDTSIDLASPFKERKVVYLTALYRDPRVLPWLHSPSGQENIIGALCGGTKEPEDTKRPALRWVQVEEIPARGDSSTDDAPATELFWHTDYASKREDKGTRKKIDRLELAGEHGYRFFPSFYHHVFETMSRIPIRDSESREVVPFRSVLDNLVSNDYFTVCLPDGALPREIPRKRPGSLDEAMRFYRLFHTKLGIPLVDLIRYQLRILQYMTTSPERRRELERISWKEYLGFESDHSDGYSAEFKEAMDQWPQALVGLHGGEADTRTFGNIIIQQYCDQLMHRDRRDSTLNGPTTEAWFDHWRDHLALDLGVTFYRDEAVALYQLYDAPQSGDGPFGAGEVRAIFRHGLGYHDRLAPQTLLEWMIGEPAPQEESPPNHPLHPLKEALLPGNAILILATPPRETLRLAETLRGRKRPPWKPFKHRGEPFKHRGKSVFQELDELLVGANHEPFLPARLGISDPGVMMRHYIGIQYFFLDRDVPFSNGHMYLPRSDWGLSAISQAQYRSSHHKRAHTPGGLSLDIGWFQKKTVLPDPQAGEKKRITAWEATRSQMSRVVWYEVLRSVKPLGVEKGEFEDLEKRKTVFHIGRGLIFGQKLKRPGWLKIKRLPTDKKCWETLYLNPWFWYPDGVPSEDDEKLETPTYNNTPYFAQVPRAKGRGPGRLNRRRPLQGYEIEFGNVVVCGTYMATFTRLGSMEAANESARHAVNGVLRAFEAFEPGDTNRRRTSLRAWALPPSTDSEGSEPSGEPSGDRSPSLPPEAAGSPLIEPLEGHTPDGDSVGTRSAIDSYCDIQTLEVREPDDLQFFKRVDKRLYEEGLPHILEIMGVDAFIQGMLVRPDDPVQEEAVERGFDALAGLMAGTPDDIDALRTFLPTSWLRIMDLLAPRVR